MTPIKDSCTQAKHLVMSTLLSIDSQTTEVKSPPAETALYFCKGVQARLIFNPQTYTYRLILSCTHQNAPLDKKPKAEKTFTDLDLHNTHAGAMAKLIYDFFKTFYFTEVHNFHPFDPVKFGATYSLARIVT